MLTTLEPFMLTAKMLQTSTKYKIIENDNLSNEKTKLSCSVSTIKKTPQSQLSAPPQPPIMLNKSTFVPIQKDTLFWCFYIMKHGLENYNLLGEHTFVIEKKLKFQYVEDCRKQSDYLKSKKLISMSELENQLANDNVIQLGTFLSLCVLENLNVIYFNSTTYYEIVSTEFGVTHVIEKQPTPPSLKYKKSKLDYNYGYVGLLNEDLKTHRLSCYKMETLDKPLKCISSYKVKEIEDICHLFKINIFSEENKEYSSNNNKKTKSELFHFLQKHLEIIK
jgi:hypothetical protein